MSNEKRGRTAAETFRDEFGLGIEPISNMARLVEQKLGIGVAYVGNSTPGHGMTMRFGEHSLMAAGSTEHPMRLRSTLAHELGHLRLGSINRRLDHNEWSERTAEEIQADAFARHLLVPLAAMHAAVQATEPTVSLLSDLVQKYRASPQIVAIQLREVDAIDQSTASEWSTLTTGRLAAQFGWHAEYAALAVESKTPRAPQTLLARAIAGYRWDLISPAAIARLGGISDPRLVIQQLAADGISPFNAEDAANTPDRPAEANPPLTAEELSLLMGDTD